MLPNTILMYDIFNPLLLSYLSPQTLYQIYQVH